LQHSLGWIMFSLDRSWPSRCPWADTSVAATQVDLDQNLSIAWHSHRETLIPYSGWIESI
jgi:hypothetical protein